MAKLFSFIAALVCCRAGFATDFRPEYHRTFNRSPSKAPRQDSRLSLRAPPRFGFNGAKTKSRFPAQIPALSISNAAIADSGEFDVIVTNVFGKAQSQKATLTVHPGPPEITLDPFSQGAMLGTTINLDVKAVGTTPISWKWYFNNENIPGESGLRLTLTNIDESKLGPTTRKPLTPSEPLAPLLRFLTNHISFGGAPRRILFHRVAKKLFH